MFSIIVTTHGELTNGFDHTIKMILGEQENLYFNMFSSTQTTEEYENEILQTISNIDNQREILILTDLFGGTPWNISSKLALSNDRIKVISGVNLPMVIEATMKTSESLDEAVGEIVESTKVSIVKLEINNNISEDDE